MTMDAFWGQTATAWTAIAAAATAAAALIALVIGVASSVIAGIAARAAARAANSAEDQGRILKEQLEASYPLLEATVSGETLQEMPNDGVVPITVLHGGTTATNVDAWVSWGGQWMKGSWPVVSPRLSLEANQTVNIPVSLIASLQKSETPFADFDFGSYGMCGVVWDRPDGRWRHGRGLGQDMVATQGYVLGRCDR